MVRNAKKKALYEIIVGARSKPGFEQLRPKIGQQETAEQPKPESEPTPSFLRWVRKPRLVQLNAGRIEFSVPYQIGIAAALGAILVVLLAFRLGEWVGGRAAARNGSSQSRSGQTAGADTAVKRPANSPAKETSKVEQPAAATSGRNRIVIKIYQVQAHLEPVKEYFDKVGVATEIIERNNLYYLVTKNGYDNPDRPGTNGYEAKQKIIELGAGYKAPAGYETFGPKPFNDAFGMRFEE